MLTLCAQAPNTFITSQTYRKRLGDVILGNSGNYSSALNLQERIECGLIKNPLISNVSRFIVEALEIYLGGKPTNQPLWWRD